MIERKSTHGKHPKRFANVMMKKTEADLAAYRAVVRELADLLQETGEIASTQVEWDKWDKKRDELLTHPLVQQAREAPHE